MHAGLYQRMWEVVGDIMCRFVLGFFESSTFPKGVNDTILTLIPKIPNSESTSRLRPISLCNVGYKIITNTIENILKELMDQLVAPKYLSKFVPGR